MKAVILAGGRGTRLRPYTDSIPKPMMPVGGKPFLRYLVENLMRYGIHDFVLCTGYLADQVEKYFGNGESLGCSIEYSQEVEPLGTGGALKKALDLAGERFLALNGDTFLDMPYDTFTSTKTSLPVLMVLTADPSKKMNARCLEGRVVAFGEGTVAANSTDAGVYMIERDAFRSFPKNAFSFEMEFLSDLASRGRLGAYPVEDRFYDIGTPARLRDFQDFAKSTHLS